MHKLSLQDFKKELYKDDTYSEFRKNLPLEYRLARYLKDARQEKGWSQNELANKIGTTQSSIARVESGKILPSLTFLKQLAKAYNSELLLPRFSFFEQDDRAFASGFMGSEAAKEKQPPPTSDWSFNTFVTYHSLPTSQIPDRLESHQS